MNAFVAVAGSIATGKTGLVKRLACSLDGVALCEDVGSNPYFDRFYDDPDRWAFHSQVAFAADALSRQAAAGRSELVVQDRTILEAVDVFGWLMRDAGLLTDEEFGTLCGLRDCGTLLSRQPTLLIYLHAPARVLLARARGRGRVAEKKLTLDYLERLCERYERFVMNWSGCPVISVDTGERDLRGDSEYGVLMDELHSVQEL